MVTMMSFYVMTAVSDVGMLNYRYNKMSSWVLYSDLARSSNALTRAHTTIIWRDGGASMIVMISGEGELGSDGGDFGG